MKQTDCFLDINILIFKIVTLYIVLWTISRSSPKERGLATAVIQRVYRKNVGVIPIWTYSYYIYICYGKK